MLEEPQSTVINLKVHISRRGEPSLYADHWGIQFARFFFYGVLVWASRTVGTKKDVNERRGSVDKLASV